MAAQDSFFLDQRKTSVSECNALLNYIFLQISWIIRRRLEKEGIEGYGAKLCSLFYPTVLMKMLYYQPLRGACCPGSPRFFLKKD